MLFEPQKIKECLEKYFDIDILASENNPDSQQAAGMLLLSLKKLNKNANLLEEKQGTAANSQEIKQRNSTRADFLISIKEGGTKLSQLFYEKTDAGLNLFLKTDGKELKKEDILLQPLKFGKLLITIGLASCNETRSSALESSCPVRGKTSNGAYFILNIDNQAENKNFGDINVVEQGKALTEITFEIIKIASKDIVEKGITSEPSKRLVGEKEKTLFERAFWNLQFKVEKNLLFSSLSHLDFLNAKTEPKDIKFSLEKLASGIFPFQNFLLLWEQNSSPLTVKGVFYSPNNQEFIAKLTNTFPSQQKGKGLMFDANSNDLNAVQDKILNLLNN
ncbi:MAG: hypothetical protein PHW31_03530 [Candidatus Pacebacteria bacterium]|nr:hypothetical protein [Candidatus Paceibacterota bacterium]